MVGQGRALPGAPMLAAGRKVTASGSRQGMALPHNFRMEVPYLSGVNRFQDPQAGQR
jgi:hypothetical protein